MSSVHEHEWLLENLRLAGVSWGNEKDTPVLMLHGWLDNANTFATLAPQLENCYSLAVDLVGHGRSDHKSKDASQPIWEYVYDIYQLVEKLGWTEFVLVGHSMGAVISSLFAGTFPDRVSKLVLIESLGPISGNVEESPEQLAKHITSRHENIEDRRFGYASVEEALKARMNGFGPVSRTAAESLFERSRQDKAGRYFWSSDHRLRLPSAVRLTEDHVQRFLRAIEAETLIIIGDEGFMANPDVMQSRVDCLKSGSVVQLPRGHHLHLEPEHTEAVANVMNQFLKDNR